MNINHTVMSPMLRVKMMIQIVKWTKNSLVIHPEEQLVKFGFKPEQPHLCTPHTPYVHQHEHPANPHGVYVCEVSGVRGVRSVCKYIK